jgi:AcrR family transcriptional regulator
MENAFWELLEKNPYEKITVTDIVEHAGVNRNSFYYHYNKLDTLAQTAIRNCVNDIVKTLPEVNQDHTETWRNIVVQTLGVPSNMKNLQHVRLLTSDHTSPQLLEYINQSMYDSLSEWLNLGNHIGTVPGLTMEFIIGGILCLIATWPTFKHKCNASELCNIDSALIARTLYLALADDNGPSFWVQLLRTMLKNADSSLLNAIIKTEIEDPEFKREMDTLMTGLQHNAQPAGDLPNSTSLG